MAGQLGFLVVGELFVAAAAPALSAKLQRLFPLVNSPLLLSILYPCLAIQRLISHLVFTDIDFCDTF